MLGNLDYGAPPARELLQCWLLGVSERDAALPGGRAPGGGVAREPARDPLRLFALGVLRVLLAACAAPAARGQAAARALEAWALEHTVRRLSVAV